MAKTDVIRKWQQVPPNVIASEGGVVTSTVGVGNADTVDGFHASATAIGNTILALNGDAKLPTSITGDANTLDGYDSADLAALAEAETVTGLWTFNRGAGAPFAVASGAAKVAYLDADKLDGYEASAFPRKAEAAVITGGWTFQSDIQLDADLDFLGARSITSNGANNLTLAPAGDLVLNPGGDDVSPALSMDINLGTAMKRYLSIHAAELWVQNLVAQDVIATIGGRVTVGPTTYLTQDLGATSATLTGNGGFGIAGAGGADVFDTWVESAGDGSIVDETTVVLYGSHACKLISGPTSNTYIYQQIGVTAGKTYRLTFGTRGDGTNACHYTVYDVSNATHIACTGGTGIRSTGVTSGAGYGRVYDNFVAPAGCANIRIILYCPAADAGYGYFDDVRMWESEISVKHNEPAVNDIFYMEKAGQVEYMKVLSGPFGTGPYQYGVERNLDGTGANDWLAGDTIVNTGAADDGTIDLYAQHGILGSGSGPTIVGWVRNSSAFNDMTERWAIGNLNGLYGVGDNNVYGVGLGQYASGKANVLIDAAQGIRMRSYNTVKFQVQPDGDLFIGEDVSSPATTFLSIFTNGQTYNSESVSAGDVLFGNNSSGKANMFWDKSEGQLKFRGGASTELYIDTDGTLVAGAGAIKLNSGGLVITSSTDAWYGKNSVLFKNPNGNNVGYLTSMLFTASGATELWLRAVPMTGYPTTLYISAESSSGEQAYCRLLAETGSAMGSFSILADDTLGSRATFNCDVLLDSCRLYLGGGGLVLSSLGMGGDAPTAGCVHIPEGHLIGNVKNSLNDDTAYSFSPRNKFSAMLVSARASNYQSCSALVVFRAYTDPFCQLLVGGANTAVTTGALSGTTGADGKFTISAHTDGKVYFENRLGVTVSFHFVFIGA